MAREEERKLKALRGRVVLILSVFIVTVIVIMYFIVQPVMAAYGKRLDLPDGRMVFVLLAMAAAGLALIPASALVSILSGVKITFGDPNKPPPGGTDGQ